MGHTHKFPVSLVVRCGLSMDVVSYSGSPTKKLYGYIRDIQYHKGYEIKGVLIELNENV